MRSRRTRLLAAIAGGTMVAGVSVNTGAALAADTVNCDSFASDVTQVIKPSTDANLLSRWQSEITSALNVYGYSEDRGVIARVAGDPGPGLTPIWRLYRAGDFVWAAQGADADHFAAMGYARQRVDFQASNAPAGCLGAVSRLERDGVHRAATDAQVAGLVKDGWTNEGPSFYAKVPGTVTTPPVVGDATFSIAVIPDTQNEVSSPTGTRFANRVSWLLNNKDKLDLRYAIQIGDLTSWGDADPAQFQKASNEIRPLEAAVPWSVAAGNHDTAAVCTGGSACPGVNASVAIRDVSEYNRYFPSSRFPSLGGSYEPGKAANSYSMFSAGGKEWMVLTLELWPRQQVIEWANAVAAENPNRNIIVSTHAYLESDGSISTSNGGYGASSPRYLFDNLIKVHPNIKMVLSGHVGQAAMRTDTGNAGNKIVSFLGAFHSTTNPVRIVQIDTSAKTVQSSVYAPSTDTRYPEYATSTSGFDFG